MATIKKEIRDKIVQQALQEIVFARNYKQGKVRNWQKNEEMYYAKKVISPDSRANVDLGRMQEFVHTILSNIDNPLTFKFTKRKESQLKRVARLNAVRSLDQELNDWDMKDIAGKKQAVIYGRAIYSYFADSEGGYKANLKNVDVYDFLIDPSAGGLEMEDASYLGDYGVVLSRTDLEAGMKDGTFIKEETKLMLEGTGNAIENTQEQTNKSSRTYDQNVTTAQKEIQNPDKFKFWRWGTTFEGERYYLLLSSRAGTAIRVVPIKEIFKSGMWWYWSWAAFIDLTEFWTPSYCDYVREIFMAQSVSINQSIDNTEQINKPQRAVNVGAIENLAELKYKKDGLIKVKKDFDVNKAYQTVATPAINTPILLFNILESIQEKASGVTAASKGVSNEDTLGVYEGNERATAGRYGLLDKSYSFGYKRFARLWEHGVREHLTKKIAVDMIGPDGVQIEDVSRRDIFRKDEKFGLKIEASNAENLLSEDQKKRKIDFLAANAENPAQNAKKAYEIGASIAGFEDQAIRELMDVSEFGDAGLMSEAERDIERILDGEQIEPNMAATNAYKQRFVDYMNDNKENLNDEQFRALAEYVMSLDETIARNTARQVTAMQTKMMSAMPTDLADEMQPEGGAQVTLEGQIGAPAGAPAEETLPGQL